MGYKDKPCNRVPEGGGFTVLEVVVALLISFLVLVPLLGELGSLHGLWRRAETKVFLSNVAFRVMDEVLLPENRKPLISMADEEDWVPLDTGLEGVNVEIKVEEKPVMPELGDRASAYHIYTVKVRVRRQDSKRIFTVESGVSER